MQILSLVIASHYSGLIDCSAPDGNITYNKCLLQRAQPHLARVRGLKQTSLAVHQADLAYQAAGGTATAITLTIPTLVDGYAKTFVVGANNSGSATTINGKPLYKQNTIIAPNLTAGKAVTVWYKLSSNCFFIKDSAEGDATVADVLAPKVFSNGDDTGLVGTLVLTGTSLPSDVANGKTFYGTDAKTKLTGTSTKKYGIGDTIPINALGLDPPIVFSVNGTIRAILDTGSNLNILTNNPYNCNGVYNYKGTLLSYLSNINTGAFTGFLYPTVKNPGLLYAIDGSGYLYKIDVSSNSFSRVGTFVADTAGQLVDLIKNTGGSDDFVVANQNSRTISRYTNGGTLIVSATVSCGDSTGDTYSSRIFGVVCDRVAGYIYALMSVVTSGDGVPSYLAIRRFDYNFANGVTVYTMGNYNVDSNNPYQLFIAGIYSSPKTFCENGLFYGLYSRGFFKLDSSMNVIASYNYGWGSFDPYNKNYIAHSAVNMETGNIYGAVSPTDSSPIATIGGFVCNDSLNVRMIMARVAS